MVTRHLATRLNGGNEAFGYLKTRLRDPSLLMYLYLKAHVPYWWVNNPTLGEFCFAMIGRADIEGSKSDVAMDAWPPQASYPCGNFSDTSCWKLYTFKRIDKPRFRGPYSY
ncbi:hypothetical protein niasHT_024094 [Heterodera trifolii]|uniref:Uncharacterized protein n=1 Tax=Heterodera trifolii TaxID=157864 RepID=A0ABD2KQH4_9BILA